MIIIIKKDGQIVTDDGNPIEGKSLEGAYMLLADAQDGDSIVYDGTNHMWKAGSGGGGSFAPDITDPQDGDTLVYNATQQKWVNGAGGGQGGGGYLKVTTDPDTGALDKTWKEIHDALTNGYYVSVVLIDEMVNSAEQSQITVASALGGQYSVGVGLMDNQNWYSTDSEDGYPVPEE